MSILCIHKAHNTYGLQHTMYSQKGQKEEKENTAKIHMHTVS